MTYKNPPKIAKKGTIVRAREDGVSFNGNLITKGFLYVLQKDEVIGLYSIRDDHGQLDARHVEGFEIILEP